MEEAMIHPLTGLIAPKQVALLGPFDQSGSLAEAIWRQLQNGQARTTAINQRPTNHSAEAVRSLSQLSEAPDVVILAETDPRQAIIDCEYAGVPMAIRPAMAGLLPHLTTAQPLKTRLLTTDAYGVCRPQHLGLGRLANLPAGRVAIISQSGLVGAAMAESLGQGADAIGCSLFAAVHPSSDIQVSELLALLEQDEQTEVIGLYIERPHQTRRLLDTLAFVTHHKPLVLLSRPDFKPDEDQPADSQLRQSLYQQSGAIVASSVAMFGQLVRALAATAHPSHQRIVSFADTEPLAPDRPDWRQASALRSLSGLDDDYWLAVMPADERGKQALADWRHHTSRPIIGLVSSAAAANSADSIPTLRASGALAALLATMQQPKQAAVAHQDLEAVATQQLRRHLYALPTDRWLALPQISDLLHQADLAVMDGDWVATAIQAEQQAGQGGWPVRLWGIAPDGEVQTSRLINSRQTLRSLARSWQAKGDQLWLQPIRRRGLELSLAAHRHPDYGPMLTCQMAGIYRDAGLTVSCLLPLSDQQIRQLLTALQLPAKAAHLDGADQNSQAVAQTAAMVSRLFYGLPELQDLVLSPVIIDQGKTLVGDAKLRWAAYP
jgi:acyl-CoA synthetase (NDP forming)